MNATATSILSPVRCLETSLLQAGAASRFALVSASLFHFLGHISANQCHRCPCHVRQRVTWPHRACKTPPPAFPSSFSKRLYPSLQSRDLHEFESVREKHKAGVNQIPNPASAPSLFARLYQNALDSFSPSRAIESGMGPVVADPCPHPQAEPKPTNIRHSIVLPLSPITSHT